MTCGNRDGDSVEGGGGLWLGHRVGCMGGISGQLETQIKSLISSHQRPLCVPHGPPTVRSTLSQGAVSVPLFSVPTLTDALVHVGVSGVKVSGRAGWQADAHLADVVPLQQDEELG